MKRLLILLCILSFTIATGQPPRLELTPRGFEPVVVPFPAVPAEKLIDLTKNWAFEFTRRENGFDTTNVTTNTITITADKDNAFFYRERGEAYDHLIRYEISITFNEGSYTLQFKVVQIYHNGKRIDYSIPDYFTSDGRLKEGYDEIEKSLEATVNNIVNSHYKFMYNFR